MTKIELDLGELRELLNELNNYADEQISRGEYIKKKVECKRKEIFDKLHEKKVDRIAKKTFREIVKEYPKGVVRK